MCIDGRPEVRAAEARSRRGPLDVGAAAGAGLLGPAAAGHGGAGAGGRAGGAGGVGRAGERADGQPGGLGGAGGISAGVGVGVKGRASPPTLAGRGLRCRMGGRAATV